MRRPLTRIFQLFVSCPNARDLDLIAAWDEETAAAWRKATIGVWAMDVSTMDVSKTDCDGITGAGQYRFRDGHLIVTLYQIAIWTEHPDAIFTAAKSRLSNGITIYVLASWRLPEQSGAAPLEAVASAAGTSPR